MHFFSLTSFLVFSLLLLLFFLKKNSGLQLPDAMSLLTDSIMNGRYTSPEIRDIRSYILSDIANLEKSAAASALESMYIAAFRASGLGSPLVTPAHAASGISAADVSRYMTSRLARPDQIVVSGVNVDHDVLVCC